MKTIIPFLLFVVFSLFSCTGVKTSVQGLENESFIEIIGNPSDYANGVTVKIDDNAPIKAEVIKDHATRPKGTAYAISSGKHVVRVYDGEKLLYQKEVFIGSRETKKIYLP